MNKKLNNLQRPKMDNDLEEYYKHDLLIIDKLIERIDLRKIKIEGINFFPFFGNNGNSLNIEIYLQNIKNYISGIYEDKSYLEFLKMS
ncbi:MAG TPA: hypothetical protein PLQ44_01990 [Candidatus Paceibacterota bacterium]|nr:hypothetical protein [Candidatus Paceibacterota bacterium]HPT40352.1 hypothetical protein [Candidatus Paceibacterota bacterium]